MSDTDLDEKVYAWCWSHGTLHTFNVGNPWCTAMWERLNGKTTEQALEDKLARLGPEQFDDVIGSPAHVRYLHEVDLADKFWNKHIRHIYGSEIDQLTINTLHTQYVTSVRANPRAMADLEEMYIAGELD